MVDIYLRDLACRSPHIRNFLICKKRRQVKKKKVSCKTALTEYYRKFLKIFRQVVFPPKASRLHDKRLAGDF